MGLPPRTVVQRNLFHFLPPANAAEYDMKLALLFFQRSSDRFFASLYRGLDVIEFIDLLCHILDAKEPQFGVRPLDCSQNPLLLTTPPEESLYQKWGNGSGKKVSVECQRPAISKAISSFSSAALRTR